VTKPRDRVPLVLVTLTVTNGGMSIRRGISDDRGRSHSRPWHRERLWLVYRKPRAAAWVITGEASLLQVTCLLMATLGAVMH